MLSTINGKMANNEESDEMVAWILNGLFKNAENALQKTSKKLSKRVAINTFIYCSEACSAERLVSIINLEELSSFLNLLYNQIDLSGDKTLKTYLQSLYFILLFYIKQVSHSTVK